jgi:selenocysteine lyase/cysteine desulfurase
MVSYALDEFSRIDGVTVLGSASANERLGVVTFNIEGVRHDLVSAILNQEAGMATRNGRFCAHPYVLRLLGLDPNLDIAKIISDEGDGAVPGAVRATFGIYNTMSEVAELVRMVKLIRDRKWIGNYEADGPASGCAGNVFTSVIEV